MLYSIELLQKYKIRFAEGLKYAEDRIFLSQCMSLADSLILLNVDLHLYRENRMSVFRNRLQGIRFYEMLFLAWEDSDKFLNKWMNEEGKTPVHMASSFIGWYIPDMIEEHFRTFGRKKDVVKWLENNENYVDFVYEYGGERSIELYERIARHMTIFQLKNYIYGIVQLIYRRTERFPLFRSLWDKRKYPIVIKK